MNLVDSCGWLEYFADGPNAEFFAAPIEQTQELLVPTLGLLEVFKRVLVQRGENEALQAVATMQAGHVVALDVPTALEAAHLSTELSLPMADSVMLATSHRHGATLWTQDADFEGISGVKFKAKR